MRAYRSDGDKFKMVARSTPSLRQSELDQVQRVTAPPKPAVSQPLAGTPQVKPDDAAPSLDLSTLANC